MIVHWNFIEDIIGAVDENSMGPLGERYGSSYSYSVRLIFFQISPTKNLIKTIRNHTFFDNIRSDATQWDTLFQLSSFLPAPCHHVIK